MSVSASAVKVTWTGDASSLLGMFNATADAGTKTADTVGGAMSGAATKMSTAMEGASDKIRAALDEVGKGGLSADELQAKFTELGTTIDTSISGAMSEFTRDVEDGMVKASASTDAFKDKYASAMLQMEAATKASNDAMKASNDEEDVSKGFEDASNSAGNLFSKLGALTGGIPLVGESFSKMGDHLKEAESSGGKLSSVMSDVGKMSVFAGGAVAVGIGAESIKLGIDNQKTTTVLAANAGITVASASLINKAFLDTGGTAAWSGTQITQAYSAVAAQLATVQGKALDASQGTAVMTAAMDLAEGSNSDLASTTKALAATMQAYGLNAGQAASASDILFNVSRMTGTGVDSVSGAVDKLHARLGAAVPSLGDTGTLMADLASHGLSGSRGAQAVAASLTTLLGGSKATSAELKSLGVNVYDSSGKFIGMQGTIAALGPKLKDMSEQQQMATLKTLFGASAAQVMGQILEAGVPSWEKTSAAVKKSGSAHEAATKQNQTFSRQTEVVKSALEDQGVKIGNFLLPKLVDLGKGVASVTAFFEKHRDIAKALAIIVGGVLTAAIVVYGASMAEAFAGTALDAIKGLTAGFQELTGAEVDADAAADANPIGAIVLAVTALTIGIIELVKHWKVVWGTIKEIVKDAWHAIDEDFVQPIKGFFTDIIGFVEKHWELILGILGGPFVGAFLLVVHFRNQIIGLFTSLPGDIENAIGSLVKVGEKIAKDIFVTGIGDVLGWGKKVFGDLYSDVLKAIKSGVYVGLRIIGDITAGIGNLASWAINTFNRVYQDIENAIGSAVGIGLRLVRDIASGVSETGATIWDWFTQVAGQVGAKIGSLVGYGKKIVSDVVGGIKSIGADIWTWFSAVPGNIGNFFTGMFAMGQKIVNDLTSGISSIVGTIAGVFRGAFDSIASMWNNTVGALSFKIPSWVPGVGGDGFSMPKIPMAAAGGLIPFTPGGMLIGAGEAGPELIIPLNALSGGLPQAPQQAQNHSTTASTVLNQTNYIATTAMDPNTVASEIQWQTNRLVAA